MIVTKDSGTFLFYVSKMIQKSPNWNFAWTMYNVPDTKKHKLKNMNTIYIIYTIVLLYGLIKTLTLHHF